MFDRTVDIFGVTPERAALIEQAIAAASDYARATDCQPGRGTALASLTRTKPTAADQRDRHWPAFWTPGPDWSADERAEWDAAEAVRLAEVKMISEMNAKNARAAAGRKAAAAEEVQGRRDAELAALTDELRRDYFATPGATEELFARALPGMLEERRQQMIRDKTTGDAIARAAHKAAFHI